MRTAFTDLETTGLLDHPGAVAWEFGIVLRESHDLEGGLEVIRAADREYLWWVRPDLSQADPAALRVNRFYERTDGAGDSLVAVNLAEPAHAGERVFSDPVAVAAQLAPLLSHSLIVGQNPWFDAWFTGKFLRRNKHALIADFHLRDLSSMATGYLCGTDPRTGILGGGDPLNGHRLTPPSLRKLAIRLGIDLAPYDLDMHCALPDARLARDCHDKMIAAYLENMRELETLPSLN